MKSIAITKPDIGVLSRERLHLSPFGALSQAFAEDLLAQAQLEEGRWPFVPLELLAEGTEPPAPLAPPSNLSLQVNLHLVLEALRREEKQTEQGQAAVRILERILQLQSRQGQSPGPKQAAPKQSGTHFPTLLGTVRQTFHQHLTQKIRVASPPPPGHHAPGAVAQQAELFSRQLQMLREEGKSLSAQSGLARGEMVRLPLQAATLRPAPAAGAPEKSFRSLSPAVSTPLEAQGQKAASGVQSAALLRTATRPEAPVENMLGERAKNSLGKRLSAWEESSSASNPAHPVQEPQRDIRVIREGLPDETSGNLLPGVGMQGILSVSPLELSLPTEPEETGSTQTSRGIPRTGSLLPQRERPAQADLSAQSAGEPGKGLSKGPQATGHPRSLEHAPSKTGSAQLTSAPEAGLSSGAASFSVPGEPAAGLPTAARNIRITSEIHSPDKRGAIPQSARETTEPAALSQPLPELTLRAGPEGGHPADTSSAPPTGRSTSQAAPSRQPGASDRPAGAPASHRSDKKQAESPRQAPSQGSSPSAHSAKGSWMAPFSEKALSAKAISSESQALPQAVSSQPTTAKGPVRSAVSTGQAVSAGTAAPISPLAGRDIRMNPVRHFPMPAAETGSKIGESPALSQFPPELTLRAKPEEAATPEASGVPGPVQSFRPAARMGQSARTVQSASTALEHPPVQKGTPANSQQSVGAAVHKASPAHLTHAGEAPHAQARFLQAMSTASHPARTLSVTARDIRGRAGILSGSTAASGQPVQDFPAYPDRSPEPVRSRGEGQPGAASAAWSPPSAELALHQQAGPAGSLSPEHLQLPPSEGSSLRGVTGRAAVPDPVTLTYGPAQPASGPSAPPAEGSTQTQIPESDYVRSLPDWARRFLKTGEANSPVTRSMGVARDIASLPQPATGDTVEWTAPGYQPPQAPIAHRETHREDRPREIREVRIPDAEIQRTADRVYRIIEDRIRRERRRLGL